MKINYGYYSIDNRDQVKTGEVREEVNMKWGKKSCVSTVKNECGVIPSAHPSTNYL